MLNKKYSSTQENLTFFFFKLIICDLSALKLEEQTDIDGMETLENSSNSQFLIFFFLNGLFLQRSVIINFSSPGCPSPFSWHLALECLEVAFFTGSCQW